MSDRLITTTSNEGVQTLGSAAQRSYELVTTTLLARLGPDVAALFAEPVMTAQGAAIEWYTAIQGQPVRLVNLQEADAAGVRARYRDQIARVMGLADDLTALRTEQGFWLADALRNATSTPDDGAVWALRAADGGLVPVVVNWGRVADATGPVRGVLTAVAPRPVKAVPVIQAAPVPRTATTPVAVLPQAAPAPAERGGFLWAWLLGLGWLLLALLIALILWLVIAPCGLLPVSIRHCATASAAEELPPDAILRAEIAQAEARLGDRQRQCLTARPQLRADAVPGLPALPAAPQPAGALGAVTPVDRADLDRRLRERRALGGQAVAFSLVWQGRDDLDLSITCPSGETVGVRNRNAQCGGVLDVDANFPVAAAIEDPVENVGFARAVPGRYRIGVRMAGDQPPNGPNGFSIVMSQIGRPDQVFSGEVAAVQAEWKTEIEIAP